MNIENIKQYLGDKNPNVVRLVRSASYYIFEDTKPDTAQKRIMRYIRCSDCIGFHSLFLHKEIGSLARKEYEPFLLGEVRIDDYFYDFGQIFLELCANTGLDFVVA